MSLAAEASGARSRYSPHMPHFTVLSSRPGHRKPHPTRVTIEGTIETVAPAALEVAAKKGNEHWSVGVQPSTKVIVQGTADASFLKAGMAVEFKTELDVHDVPKEPIRELKIIAPPAESELGITAARRDDTERGKGGKGPGGKGGAGGRGKFSESLLKVVGKITACHDHKLTVRAGNRTVQAELPDFPVITFSLADPRLVTAGSAVVVRGTSLRGKLLCEADYMKVTLTEPLVGKRKPALVKSSPKSEANPPEKGEPAPPPEKEDALPPLKPGGL